MKIKTTRRKFFGLVAASPLAAKKAADAAAQDLVDKSENYLGYSVPQPNYVDPIHEKRMPAKVIRKMLANGLPDWRIEEIRRDLSHYTPKLDPDIAAKRSWSLVAKYSAQRERDFEKAVKHSLDVFDNEWIHQAREKFQRETGWYL
jgi:hypothetical protein